MDHDPVARSYGRDIRTHPLDQARSIRPDNVRKLQRDARQPLRYEQIETIESRGVDPHQRLARTRRRWLGNLGNGEVLQSAGSGEHQSLHRPIRTTR
jgi:hypothetical protein